MNKLNPKNDSLWQKPLNKIPTDPTKPWYANQRVGTLTHNKFMSNITEKLSLTTRYTNHCIRVTGITNLKRGAFSAKQVMSVSGHKSVDSLAIYERVQEDEKMMMGMCLSFSLLQPEEAIMLQNSIEVQPETQQRTPSPLLALPGPPQMSLQNEIPQENKLVQLETALAPITPNVQQDQDPNFDLMSLLAEVEDEIPDEDLVLATTQCEQSMLTNDVTTPTTTTKTAVVKKSSTYPNPTFTGCTFGSVGTINIHIHKH